MSKMNSETEKTIYRLEQELNDVYDLLQTALDSEWKYEKKRAVTRLVAKIRNWFDKPLEERFTSHIWEQGENDD